MIIVKPTGIRGGGERYEEHSFLALMQPAPAHPLKVAREQKGSTHLYQGKGKSFLQQSVYVLAEEHALCCVLVVAQFVYVVTRLFMHLLFVLQ